MSSIDKMEGSGDEPSLIVTSYIDSVEELIEAIQAVDVLGLGCVVRNEWRAVEAPNGAGGHQQVWVLELYDEAPRESGSEDS